MYLIFIIWLPDFICSAYSRDRSGVNMLKLLTKSDGLWLYKFRRGLFSQLSRIRLLSYTDCTTIIPSSVLKSVIWNTQGGYSFMSSQKIPMTFDLISSPIILCYLKVVYQLFITSSVGSTCNWASNNFHFSHRVENSIAVCWKVDTSDSDGSLGAI